MSPFGSFYVPFYLPLTYCFLIPNQKHKLCNRISEEKPNVFIIQLYYKNYMNYAEETQAGLYYIAASQPPLPSNIGNKHNLYVFVF